jgi:hypothetical protein
VIADKAEADPVGRRFGARTQQVHQRSREPRFGDRRLNVAARRKHLDRTVPNVDWGRSSRYGFVDIKGFMASVFTAGHEAGGDLGRSPRVNGGLICELSRKTRRGVSPGGVSGCADSSSTQGHSLPSRNESCLHPKGQS